MASNTAGIDTHQDTLTIGIVDANGIEDCVEVVANTATGFAEAAELLTTQPRSLATPISSLGQD